MGLFLIEKPHFFALINEYKGYKKMNKIIGINGKEINDAENEITSECITNDCTYHLGDESSGQQIYFCTRFPPTIQMVPVTSALGQQGLGLQSFYPNLPKFLCGEFQKFRELNSILGETVDE